MTAKAAAKCPQSPPVGWAREGSVPAYDPCNLHQTAGFIHNQRMEEPSLVQGLRHEVCVSRGVSLQLQSSHYI